MTTLISTAQPTFTVYPSAVNAESFRTQLNGRIRKDLELFCGIAKRALPAEADAAIGGVRALPIAARLSPAVFFWQQELQAELKAQHVEGVRRALIGLTDPAVLGAASGPFDVAAVSEGVHHEALAKLAASHAEPGELPEAAVIEAMEPAHLATARRWVDEAVQLMAAADPELLGELRELVSEVRMYEGQGPHSATSILAFGAVYVRWPGDLENGTAYLIENIAHEGSHLSVYAQMALDPLLLNAHGDNYASPLREDPRPLYGVFHQAFVLARLCRLWDRLAENGESWARPKVTGGYRNFSAAFEVVKQHGQLTEAGRSVVRSIDEMTAEITGRYNDARG